MPDLAATPKIDWVVEFAAALHRYGAPAHQLENATRSTAASMGLNVQVFAMPTALFLAFSESTLLLRTDPSSEVDLGRLAALYELRARVASGHTNPSSARNELLQIKRSPERFGTTLTVVAFGVASSAACCFLGGGAIEVGLALVLGLTTGILSIAAGGFAPLQRLFAPLAAFVVALASFTAAHHFPLDANTATLAGIIILVPGLGLTTAIVEVARGHLVAGATRLTGAAVLFLSIGLGVYFAAAVRDQLWAQSLAVNSFAPLPWWAAFVAVPFASLSFLVVLKARPREIGWVLAAGAASFSGVWLGGHALGPIAGAFLGALLTSLLARFYARGGTRPMAVTLVPGILLLVPGSLGFNSVAALAVGDIDSGVTDAFSMFTTAVAIASGLLLAPTGQAPEKSG